MSWGEKEKPQILIKNRINRKTAGGKKNATGHKRTAVTATGRSAVNRCQPRDMPSPALREL